MNWYLNHKEQFREDISEYVAQLQLHMALQARNFLPSLTNVTNSREQMLRDTQANIEKLVSRQSGDRLCHESNTNQTLTNHSLSSLRQ